MTRSSTDLLELSRLESSEAPIEGSRSTSRRWSRCCARTCCARHSARGRHQLDSDAGSASRRDPLGRLQPRPNAAKYTPPEGRWSFAGGPTTRGRTSRFAIPASASLRSTFRASPNVSIASTPGRSRETGGSGLGPAIVKHALHRHGARSTSRVSKAAAALSPVISRRARDGAAGGVRENEVWRQSRKRDGVQLVILACHDGS